MSTVPRLTRVTRDYRIMGGKPCIRGTRVAVSTIVGLLAQEHSREAVLDAYPYLEPEDLAEALTYAAWQQRSEAVEALRGLVDAMVLVPAGNELRIGLKGNLAAMLSAAQNAKSHPKATSYCK